MGLTKGDELAAQVAGVLSDRLGTAVGVTSMSRLSGGASRETWAFDATVEGAGGSVQTRALVLQRERPGSLNDGNGMGREAQLLAAAAAADVVPGRLRATHPLIVRCRARPTPMAPGGMSSVMTDPAAV